MEKLFNITKKRENKVIRENKKRKVEKVVLQIESRKEKVGKNQARRLRRLGMIPGVLYQGKDSIPVQVNTKDFNNIIRKYGQNGIFQLTFEGKQFQSLIKEMQRDPVNQKILHFDLQPISVKEKIQIHVPIQLKGQGLIESKGGVIQRQLNDIEIETFPSQIPQSIEIDVSKLEIGDSLQISDIEVGNGVKILSNPEETILSISKPVAQDENLDEDQTTVEE